MLSHCFPAPVASGEKSAVALTEVPLYMTTHFLLLPLRFSLLLVFDSLTMMCLGVNSLNLSYSEFVGLLRYAY